MSGARVRCHRCGVWIGIIDWSDPLAATISDRIVAAHAVECLPPRPKRVCSIPDCGQPVRARGWCKKHWTRWKRHGNPRAVADSRKLVTLEPLPRAQLAPVPPTPPEPTFVLSAAAAPAICADCGRPYAADAGLPDGLLRAAKAVHRCQARA